MCAATVLACTHHNTTCGYVDQLWSALGCYLGWPATPASWKSEEAYSVYFAMYSASDVLVVLYNLSLKVHTFYLKKNPLLSILWSGSMEGGSCKQLTPKLEN